jgi:hypothetical protein
LANFKGRIGRAPHAPWNEFGPSAPTPPVAPDQPKASRQQPTDFTADANMPSPAMAPSPRHRDLPPKVQTSKPASRPPNPIRQQFGEAKRTVTRRGDKAEPSRRRKRKQRDDGRQLFILAKAIMKRLARAARRTRTFFWEREIQAAPTHDMHLDPRYATWYAADPDAGSAVFDGYNQDNTSRPADFNGPTFDL